MTTDTRPTLTVEPHRYMPTAEQAEQILVAAGAEIYLHRGKLVRPIHQHTEMFQLIRVTPDYLRDVLSRHIRWQKFDERLKDYKLIDPPLEVVSYIMRLAPLHRTFPEWDEEATRR